MGLILSLILFFTVGVFVVDILDGITVQELKKEIREFRNPEYYEYSAKGICKDSVFRIVPFVRSDGKEVWNVEYRNPGWTKWGVCRCELTKEKAEEQMWEIINSFR